MWTDLTSNSGDGDENSESVWSTLKTLELRPINRYRLDADDSDPLSVTMKGKLSIHEYYAGHDGGHADILELKLVRDAENGRWRIAPEEVERTAKSRSKPQ
jgi:hypothetical protein